VIYQRQNRLSDAVNDFTRVAALPSASSATQLAARSRLEQLGKGGNVNAQRPQRSSVTLNISSASDRDAADTVAKVLDPNTFDVQVSERPSQSSRGDVRFYFREDERAAEQVRQAVESVIAERGYNVRLELRFLSTKDPVARGTIEVWLPPLTVLALPVQQYARPSLSRK
jgi:hypothetical protein